MLFCLAITNDKCQTTFPQCPYAFAPIKNEISRFLYPFEAQVGEKVQSAANNRHKQTEEKCVALAIENWGKCEVFYDAVQWPEDQRYASHAGNAEEKPEPSYYHEPDFLPAWDD